METRTERSIIRFSEEFELSRPAMMLRITALAYGANLLPLVAGFLPRDAVVVWPDIAIGLALSAAVAVLVAVQVRVGRSRPYSARLVLIQNLLAYGAVGCFAYGLSASVGIFRLVLLGPFLLMAVVGNRFMLTVSYLASVGTLAAITVGTVDPSMVPTVVLTYGAGFLVVGLFVRELALSSVKDAHQTKRFAELTTIAARADTVDHGLREMLPLAGRYLGASRISVFDVVQRVVATSPRMVWPGGEVEAEKLSERRLARLRISATDDRTLVDPHWSCISVKTDTGAQLVALIERDAPELRQRSQYESALEDVAIQAGVLLTRVDLIDRLEALTRTDSLTGLPNRRALTAQLEHEVAVARRTEGSVSVVMIDLDLFKSYNDTFGHVAGDELLKAVAEMMRCRLRTTDFVARYGGEEFCAILPCTEAGNAAIMFAELHRRCGELDALAPVTFSAGVSEWDGEETITELLTRADEALYQAKAGGRDQTQIARTWADLEVGRDPRPIVRNGQPVKDGSTIGATGQETADEATWSA